jgi:hypothetical protein
VPRLDLQDDFGMGGCRVSLLRFVKIYSSIGCLRDAKSSDRCELMALLIWLFVVISLMPINEYMRIYAETYRCDIRFKFVV